MEFIRGASDLREHSGGRLRRLAAVIALGALLSGCGAKDAPAAQATLTLDGAPWKGGSLSPETSDDLRVYVTLDGAPLADLPFSEAHSLDIRLPDGGENHVACTGEAVYMSEANCDNQDCVNMGAVTRENLEMRVLGGFIICLPHRISVEVRGE